MRKPVLAGILAVLLSTTLWAEGRAPRPSVPVWATISADRVFFRALPSPDGGFYVVWNSTDAVGQPAVIGQHFGPDGLARWASPGIVLQSGLQKVGSWDACADGQGGVLVSAVVSGGLSLKRIQATGVSLWSQVISSAAINASIGSLVSTDDGAGGAYVTWTQENGLLSTVWAQHEQSAGRPLWAIPGVPVALSATRQTDPNVVSDGQGGVLITWKSFREEMSQVWAQRLSSDGKRLWTDAGVGVQSAAGDLRQRIIQTDTGNGGLVVSWTQGVAGVNRLFFQHISPEGLRSWSGGGTTGAPPINEQWNPVLLSNRNGSIWIGWEEIIDGHDSKVQVIQRGPPNGTPWAPGQIQLSNARGAQARLMLALDGAGGVFAVWVDNRAGVGIYLQHIDSLGRSLFGDGVPVAVGIKGSQRPQIVAMSKTQVAVVWLEEASDRVFELRKSVIDLSGPKAPGE